MKTSQFSEKEALSVIQEMVNVSQRNFKQDAKHLLWWGWLIFAAAVIHILFLYVEIQQGYFIWAVALIVGFSGSFYMGWKEKREANSRSYIDRVSNYLWIGSMAPLAITLGLGTIHGWTYAYPIFMAIYGWGTFVNGKLLKFVPLVWGGIGAWIIGFATLFVGEQWLLPMLALAVLVSYLIPGHMLKNS